MAKKTGSTDESDYVMPAVVIPDPPVVKKPAATENASGFFVYLGPWIPGVLGHGDVIEGTRDEVLEKLADIIKKYPLVRSVLVPGDILPQSLVQLKTPGTALYKNYRRVLKKKEA